jgi:hypothetical protein
MGEISDLISVYGKLGPERAAGYLLIAAAIFAPSVLSLFWFDRALFESISTSKLLLLTGTIGALACISVAAAAVDAVKEASVEGQPSDGLAAVTMAGIGLLIQMLAILATWLCGLAAHAVGLSSAFFYSTTGFSILAILMGLTSSIHALTKRK